MPDDLLQRIDRTLSRAADTGALLPIRTERTLIDDAGIGFTVRWVSTLAHKDAARVEAAVKRDPDFNPFLPPDPELTIGPLGDLHLGVLNKFPVIDRHLLIVTRAFEAQTAPLTRPDFIALAIVMASLGGLGFYNGGSEAGASQRHKHLQWVPDAAETARLGLFTDQLPTDLPPFAHTALDTLPWRHTFVRLPPCGDAVSLGEAMHHAFRNGCETLGIDPAADPMPPYNFLVTRDWMSVIPRVRERHENISVNALGFAGSLFVRRPEEIETVRAIGPLRLLAAVARPR